MIETRVLAQNVNISNFCENQPNFMGEAEYPTPTNMGTLWYTIRKGIVRVTDHNFVTSAKNNKYINLLVLLVGILIRTACHTLAHAFDCQTGHICVRCRWPRGSHVMDRCTWISTTSTHLTAPVIDYSFWSVKNFDSISNLVLLLHACKWYSAMHVTILDWRRLNTFGNMLIEYTKQMIPPGAHTRSGNQTHNF